MMQSPFRLAFLFAVLIACGSSSAEPRIGEAVTASSAIEQLSLRYRVEVYSRFHTDRAEYDRRIATWRKLMATWEAAETHEEDGEKVVIWLTTALERMRYDESAVLPPLPKFDASARPDIAPKQSLAPRKDLPSFKPTVTPPPQTSSPPIIKQPSLTDAKPPAIRKAFVNSPDVPRTAHRVEKPVVPRVEAPPRVAIRNVRPVIAPPEVPRAAVGPQVTVDVNELTVRIQSYNLALKELTGSLHEETRWPIERLSRTLDELSELADRRVQLTWYRDLVSLEEKNQVGQLMSLDPAVALLGAKIFVARERLSEGNDAPDESAAAHLNELSRKLAQLAAKRAK